MKDNTSIAVITVAMCLAFCAMILGGQVANYAKQRSKDEAKAKVLAACYQAKNQNCDFLWIKDF